MIEYILIPICAFCNRARGSAFGNLMNSTEESRLLATFIMAVASAAVSGDLIVFPIVWGGLMLWCTFAHDNYWSAAIGNPTDIKKPTFPLIDWIMLLLSPMSLRLWGTIAMGLRGMLLYPMFIALGYFGHPSAYSVGLYSILQGVPYVFGGLFKKDISIKIAEHLWGACIGLMLAITLHG